MPRDAKIGIWCILCFHAARHVSAAMNGTHIGFLYPSDKSRNDMASSVIVCCVFPILFFCVKEIRGVKVDIIRNQQSENDTEHPYDSTGLVNAHLLFL